MSERLTVQSAAELLFAARANGQPVATVLAVTGPCAGARLLVYANGATRGTLGSAQLDAAAFHHALDVLAGRTAVLVDADADTRLFCEPFLPADRLIIVGAGHIAVPLAQIGALLDFDVIVLDDRDEFVTGDRFPNEVQVVRTDFRRPFERIDIDPRSSVVLVTRAHRFDYDCLKELLGRNELPRYIGMIGSRRRVRAAFHALLEAGVPAAQLDAVHAPVGLDIGAETPAEIAVSIAAELIRVRAAAGSGRPIHEQERVLERFFTSREAE
ncbi:MAG TPA: XdhC/CoxI family protein [Longimicrobiales bacterium]|nr:XdhC/CoxI family protein [Longimicrobiales bacterium]